MKIQGAIKGADSIKFGIQKMQQEEFLVTDRSVNLIKELRMYSWATDREGNSLNKPIDDYNHTIDSVRYYFNSKPKAKAPRSRII
jgi:phage terminase large subunit